MQAIMSMLRLHRIAACKLLCPCYGYIVVQHASYYVHVMVTSYCSMQAIMSMLRLHCITACLQAIMSMLRLHRIAACKLF